LPGNVAFAIDCFEKGIITTANTGSLELKSEYKDIQLFKKWSPGAVGPACSSKIAAVNLGKFFQYAIRRGQELPMHDGRRTWDLRFTAVEAHRKAHGLPSKMFRLWKKSAFLKSVRTGNEIYMNKEREEACSCYTQLFNSAGFACSELFWVLRDQVFEWLNAAPVGKRLQGIHGDRKTHPDP
jgi:aldehyde:ferredoxin oxidoreductase